MGKGEGMRTRVWTRRLAVAVSAAVISAVVAGPVSANHIDESQFPHEHTEGLTIDPDTWSGRGEGDVVRLSVGLPPILQGVFDTIGLESPLPGTIEDTVVSSLAEAEWIGDEAAGGAVGELLDADGTIGSLVADVLETAGETLPRAEATLGQNVTDSLASVNASGIHVGVGEVSASAAEEAVRDVVAAGKGAISEIGVTLGDILELLPGDLGDQVREAIATLLGLLYGDDDTNPAESVLPEGVVGTLNGALDDVLDTLTESGIDLEGITNLEISIPEITVEQLLDEPVISSGTIVSDSDVADVGGQKVASSESYIEDLSILGGLLRAEVLKATATAQVGPNGPSADADRKIVGLKIGDNVLDVASLDTLNGIQINGKGLGDILGDAQEALAEKGVALPVDLQSQIEGLYSTLINVVVGLGVSQPPMREEAGTSKSGRQEAHAQATALNISVAPLSQPISGLPDAVNDLLGEVSAALPTVGVVISSAQADAGSVPLKVLGNCVGECSPRTGIPVNWYLLGVPMLLGAAVITRKLALAKR